MLQWDSNEKAINTFNKTILEAFWNTWYLETVGQHSDVQNIHWNCLGSLLQSVVLLFVATAFTTTTSLCYIIPCYMQCRNLLYMSNHVTVKKVNLEISYHFWAFLNIQAICNKNIFMAFMVHLLLQMTWVSS